METVEVVVYLMVAIIVGVLILGLIRQWDAEGTYDNVKDLVLGDDTTEYRKMTKEDAISEVFRFWKNCGMGSMNVTERIYITEPKNENLTFQGIINETKKLNLCDTLSSASEGCGTREDLVMRGEIDLPSVVKLHCNVTDEKLYIR